MASREAALKVSSGENPATVESWIRTSYCGGTFGLKAANLSLSVEETVSPQGIGGAILKIVGSVFGDLSGKRVTVVYREPQPGFLRGFLGSSLVLRESCTVLEQSFLSRKTP